MYLIQSINRAKFILTRQKIPPKQLLVTNLFLKCFI